MSRDPHNHYHILFVQPDAPPEVIKAAWRALMSARRGHPDLGGDHDAAVRLNAAYAVLGDPQRRAAYDATLRAAGDGFAPGPSWARAQAAPARAAPAPAQAATPPPPPPSPPRAASPRICAFCGQPHSAPLRRDSRCAQCRSPLAPLPDSGRRGMPDTAPGRRRDPRFARDAVVELWLPGQAVPQRARLHDLSFSGLQLQVASAVPRGSVARVVAPWFDALFSVVACRALGDGYALHGRLQTLLMQQQSRGMYVNAKA